MTVKRGKSMLKKTLNIILAYVAEPLVEKQVLEGNIWREHHYTAREDNIGYLKRCPWADIYKK